MVLNVHRSRTAYQGRGEGGKGRGGGGRGRLYTYRYTVTTTMTSAIGLEGDFWFYELCTRKNMFVMIVKRDGVKQSLWFLTE